MIDNSFFANYYERLENLYQEFREQIQHLPPEAIDWIPAPEMNSLGVLLAHTAGSLRYWIGDIALGEPSSRVRVREFQTKGLSGAEMLRRLEAVLDYARTALPRLSLEDLEKEQHTGVEDEVVTCGWALLHALEHGYLHLGHLQLTCQLWKAKSTSTNP